MFTGIIEEIGTVIAVKSLNDGVELSIGAGHLLKKLNINDSICIDGACQTVIRTDKKTFTVQAVGETLDKSTLKTFRPGRKVNLESALTLNSPLGGHLVQGHVNGTAPITAWIKRGENYLLELRLKSSLLKYCISEGSIAVDGISLTIAHLVEQTIGISIIPHTVSHTTLHERKTGDVVNIETDMIARYVERFLDNHTESLLEDKLKKWGY
jgi:riboflavin synthase